MPLKQKPIGKLISFEGPEGSGKTTQIELLTSRLKKAGRQFLTTREPGGTAIGEQIRNILIHNSKGDEMTAETELLLFTAARAQLVREIIAPAMIEGKIVLCDRYMDSTTVYQGVARNLASNSVSAINHFAVGNVLPDITIIIDVPLEVSLERIKKRNNNRPDRMERQSLDFYKKVREGYLLLARSLPRHFLVVDGTKSKEEIHQFIWTHIQSCLEMK